MALVLGILGPGVRGAEFTLFKSVWGDVIVATDMTPQGRELTPPSPDQPVYFKGTSLGRKLGSIPGDREPEKEQLNRFVTEILAKQGYLDARPGAHEPALFLVVQWGYLSPGSDDLLWFLGYDASRDIAAPVFPGMLGPEVWRRGMRSGKLDTLLMDAQSPIYGIIITAFEFKSARTPDPVIYWQTRIGLPAHGKSMAAALPAMLVAAGPAIGRPADGPVFLDVDNARQGTVKFGELKFLDAPVSSSEAEGTKK
jgi:hypothetical protein